MGSQSSFIYTNRNSDINKIISLFEKYNIRTAKDELCSCCAKVTLNKQVRTIDSWGCVGNNETFRKGKQFLLLEGERSCQRNIENMFDMDSIQYTNKELDLIYKIEIIFADYFPCDKIYENNEYATIEDLDICTKILDENTCKLERKLQKE